MKSDELNKAREERARALLERADMRIQIVQREINQGALAGLGSEISEHAAALVVAALDSYDKHAATKIERQVRDQITAEQTRAQKVVQFLEREIAAGNRIAVVEPSGRVVRIELAPDAGRGKS